MDFKSKFGQKKWVDYNKIYEEQIFKAHVRAQIDKCENCGRVVEVGYRPVSGDYFNTKDGYVKLGISCWCMKLEEKRLFI